MREPSINDYVMVKLCFISERSGMMELRVCKKPVAKSQPLSLISMFKMLHFLAILWMQSFIVSCLPYSYVRHGGMQKSIKY